MNGQIHPRWCRFKNVLGEVITVESLTVERENSVDDPIHRAFCVAHICTIESVIFVYVIIYHFIHGLWNKEYLSKNIITYYHVIELSLDKFCIAVLF